jgi:hypothetical protein
MRKLNAPGTCDCLAFFGDVLSTEDGICEKYLLMLMIRSVYEIRDVMESHRDLSANVHQLSP